MRSPSPPRNPRKWKYSWEALAHVPILRLFLFHPEIDPSTHCVNLAASLLPDCRQLVVGWSEGGGGGETVEVTVPVPRVLVDVGSGVAAVSRNDHVEVRLILVLPVDHPIVADFRDALRSHRDDGMECGDPSMPLSLESDLKSLRTAEVHFYCKACSTRLTRKCLRNFVELPSVDWKEVADNWFGACCCSFGGISEKLVLNYITSYACTEGTCLVDPASVTICKDDLEGSMLPGDSSDNHGEAENTCSTVSSTVNEFHGCKIASTYDNNDNNEAMASPSGVAVKESVDKGTVHGHILPGFLHQKGEAQSMDTEVKKLEDQNPLSCISPTFSSAPGTPFLTTDRIDVYHLELKETNTTNRKLPLESELSYSFPPTELVSIRSPHCCSSKINGSLDLNLSYRDASSTSIQSRGKSTYLKTQKSSHNGSLGGGFVIRSSNMLDDVRWAEFRCGLCSSLLGSYPYSHDFYVPIDGGIRLFKCCISSSMPTSGTGDIFRNHTLQTVFLNHLLESATNELSFRTIVRDVTSKLPMLKLVIINSKVWCLTGYCFENEAVKSTSNMEMQPFAKVLYSDCTMESEGNMRLEEWSTKNHADEIYMLASQIKDLIEGFKSAQDRLPYSCSILQGMSLAFIER